MSTDIRDCNNLLKEYLAASKPDAQQEPIKSSRLPAFFDQVRSLAQGLHATISRGWKCDGHSHFAYLLLEKMTIPVISATSAKNSVPCAVFRLIFRTDSHAIPSGEIVTTLKETVVSVYNEKQGLVEQRHQEASSLASLAITKPVSFERSSSSNNVEYAYFPLHLSSTQYNSS